MMRTVRYDIPHARRAGSFVINSGDISHITAQPSRACVEVLLRYHVNYHSLIDDATFTTVKEGQRLRVELDGSQIEAIAEQDREQQVGFCKGDSPNSEEGNCYDYGKSERPPRNGCLRCALLRSCHEARLGDYRKVRPEPIRREMTMLQSASLILAALSVLGAMNYAAGCKEDARIMRDENRQLKAALTPAIVARLSPTRVAASPKPRHRSPRPDREKRKGPYSLPGGGVRHVGPSGDDKGW